VTAASRDPSEFVTQLTREPLGWTQPHRFRRGWELWNGQSRIATLEPMSRVTLRLLRNLRLVMRSPGGDWDLVQRWNGFDLRRAGEERALVEFRGLFNLLTTRGRVTVGADQLTWTIRFHGFRRASYELLNASDFPLLRVQPKRSFLRSTGTITIEDAGRRHPQIEALTMFAWGLAISQLRNRGTFAT